MKLGVITDCFKKPLKEALTLASRLQFDGVQIYATTGEFSPQTLTPARKAEIKAQLADCGLEISALCGDMGGYGYQIEADNPERIEKTKAIIDLAVEFNTRVITTHIGVIPSDRNHPRYQTMLKALNACGSYAQEKGVTLAIETGPETAATLKMFLDDTLCGVGVNLDPANFVMVTGQDPVEAVKLLGSYIVHTHVKDGIMLKKTDPKIIYDHFAEGGIEALNVADYFLETPLGEGKVDFSNYLAALRDVGYDGYLTIERETGSNPASDIVKARDVVLDLLK
jgi:sugar phosphate isomerase/epimerase